MSNFIVMLERQGLPLQRLPLLAAAAAATAATLVACKQAPTPAAVKMLDAVSECRAGWQSGQCSRAQGLSREVKAEFAARGNKTCEQDAFYLGLAAHFYEGSRLKVAESQSLPAFEANSKEADTADKDLDKALATYRKNCT